MRDKGTSRGKMLRGNVVVSFSMPRQLHRKLQREARENMLTASAQLRRILLERYTEREAAYEHAVEQ